MKHESAARLVNRVGPVLSRPAQPAVWPDLAQPMKIVVRAGPGPVWTQAKPGQPGLSHRPNWAR